MQANCSSKQNNLHEKKLHHRKRSVTPEKFSKTLEDLKNNFDELYTVDSNECWKWNRYIHWTGYGHKCVCYRIMMAHRLAWELFKGPIPKGMIILHACKIRDCVNPDHLYMGTYADR